MAPPDLFVSISTTGPLSKYPYEHLAYQPKATSNMAAAPPNRERLELLAVQCDPPTRTEFRKLWKRFPRIRLRENGFRIESRDLSKELAANNVKAWFTKDFDTYLHINTNGERFLGLRIPRDILPMEFVELFLDGRSFLAEHSEDSLCLYFQCDVQNLQFAYQIDWIRELSGLHKFLRLRDWRILYLGWLASAVYDAEDLSVPEPPVPPGLDDLPPPLVSLAAFLDIPIRAIMTAAEASKDIPKTIRPDAPADSPEIAPEVEEILDEELQRPWIARFLAGADPDFGIPKKPFRLTKKTYGSRQTSEIVEGLDLEYDDSPLSVLEDLCKLAESLREEEPQEQPVEKFGL